MTIRTDLNAGIAQAVTAQFARVQIGELLSLLIAGATPTEAGLTATANVGTLANLPSKVFQVNATAGTLTGVKTLREAVAGTLPAANECVWTPGTQTIRFAATDAVTTYSVLYSRATTRASILEANIDVP